MQARSSGGERYLDTVEVGGSRPPAPTIKAVLGGQDAGIDVSMPFLFLLKRNTQCLPSQ